MARRLVRMPMLPRVTSSWALCFWGGAGASRKEGSAEATFEESQVAPMPVTVRRRKSLLCMAYSFVRIGYACGWGGCLVGGGNMGFVVWEKRTLRAKRGVRG